jgi:septal ring factor EnvC (AmiA/AmiB activator)
MPESDATDNKQQAPLTQDPWHDKVLGDAIGYTKGLVAILDSLNEGFRRRGREIEELRDRLTILQNERRTILEERGGLAAPMGSLTAERDELRSGLEERRRDLDQLREALAQSQAALEGRTREIEKLEAAVRDSTRQAGELREMVRNLERELLRVRQSAAQAQQEQVALRDSLASTEGLLETARRDLAGSQEQITSLQSSLEGERAQAEHLQDRLRSQWEEFSSLNTTMQAARGFLREIAAIVGGPQDLAGGGGEADQEEAHWAELVQRVKLQTETSAQTQEELASLRQLAESVREVLGTTDQLPERLRKLVAGRTLLIERVQQITADWRRLRQERAESAGREQQLREENERLAARVTALTGELEIQRAEAERRRQPRADDRPVQRAEAASTQQREEGLQFAVVPGLTLPDLEARKAAAPAKTPPAQADLAPGLFRLTQAQVEAPGSPGGSPPSAGPHRTDEEMVRPQGRFADMVVECTVESSGGETLQRLRGRVSGVNEVGMVAAFEERLSAGQKLKLRLIRRDREIPVPGRVVQVQPPTAAPGALPTFEYLVRFNHPDPNSVRRIRAFLFS